jgi:hypothetical protein
MCFGRSALVTLTKLFDLRASARKLRTSADWLLIGLLVLASLASAGVHVSKHTTVSPIDEYVYIDYLDKVPSQLVVHRGEETGEFARKYLACHGVRLLGEYPEAMCKAASTEADEEIYPNDGYTSADIYTPLYFATTWLVAQPLMFFGADLVQAGRLVGGIWLALAAVVLFMSLRRLLLARSLAAAISLLAVGSLPAYWSNTYVSTDATGLAAGAVMLYVGVRVLNRDISSVWLLVAGVAVTLFKLQNLIAAVPIALVLLVNGWQSSRVQSEHSFARKTVTWCRQRDVLVSLSTLVVALAGQGMWYLLRSVSEVGGSFDQGVSSQLTFTALARELFKFMPNLAVGAANPEVLGPVGIVIAGVGTLATVGGVIGLIGASEKRSFESRLAVSTLTTATLGAPALALASYVFAGAYVDLVPRYGIALFPIALACAGLLFRKRPELNKYILIVAVVGFASSLTFAG